jgi:hypothetical protein
MASNIYTRHTITGDTMHTRKGTQGRKPSGLGKPKLYRLYNKTNEKLAAISEILGYLYNENEIVREAVEKHVDFIYTELVKQ